MEFALQKSEQWHALRCGKITASRIKDLSAKPKDKNKVLNATLFDILQERLTGKPKQKKITCAMQWGIDHEPQAIIAYEHETWRSVQECGFIEHPTIPLSGASPDGLVGDDGLIEIKCPETATHLNTLITGQVPSEYLPQITWQMACTGRSWCDFVSFDPRLPENLQIKIIRVHRTDVDIDSLEKLVIECNNKLDEIIGQLN